MSNLSDIHSKLTHRQKLEIICAWELMYGQRHPMGVVPFLDKAKVERALVDRLAEGPNIDGICSLLIKLGTRVRNIATENIINDVQTSDGKTVSIMTGTKTTVTIERERANWELATETITIRKP